MQDPNAELFAHLLAAFDPKEVKSRDQAGRKLHYITARTAMNRLDAVVGPSNWWDDYTPHESSVLCRLTIRLPDGQTLTKCDAGGYAGMADSGDDDKSGYSDAFKRAAVKFGVARYLYRDGVPDLFDGEVPNDAPSPAPAPERVPGKGDAYEPPAEARPSQARPPTQREQPRQEPARRDHPPRQGNGQDRPQGNVSRAAPRSGKALFAWSKDMEQKYEVGLIKYINGWAKLQDFPGRMVEWDGDQVALAHKEAVRKLQTLVGDLEEVYQEALSN